MSYPHACPQDNTQDSVLPPLWSVHNLFVGFNLPVLPNGMECAVVNVRADDLVDVRRVADSLIYEFL